MKTSVSTEINANVDSVWQVISDIESSPKMINGILNIEVLNKPDNGLLGFKWTETREMFGKESSETMWITDVKDQQYYCTQAQSHGSVYLSKLSISPNPSGCLLTMDFEAQSQTLLAKTMSCLMGPFIKGSVTKMLRTDLHDIKDFVESQA